MLMYMNMGIDHYMGCWGIHHVFSLKVSVGWEYEQIIIMCQGIKLAI